MKIPAAFQPYFEVFQALDGHAQLWSPSGQFLGRLSFKADYINSIINPKGDYGSPYSLTSIHNPQCQYGGEKGKYSPFNPNSKNPPIVFYRSQPLLVVSTNLELHTNGLKIIDPYLLLAIAEALSDVTPAPVSQPSKSKLIHTWVSHEYLKEKLMQLSRSPFRWARAS